MIKNVSWINHHFFVLCEDVASLGSNLFSGEYYPTHKADNDDDDVDAGICKAANEEHARHLPIMNGIKEDIKSIGVLANGSPAYQEAFSNLSKRLKSLLVIKSTLFMFLEYVIRCCGKINVLG